MLITGSSVREHAPRLLARLSTGANLSTFFRDERDSLSHRRNAIPK